MFSICFVAHNAYGALAGVDTGHAGGIERQQSLMARWMAGQGYKVSMITWDEGVCEPEVQGVKIYTIGKRESGLPGLRFFHPRWTGLAGAMKLADSDLYYYNCGDLGLGQVVLWAHQHGKKVVHSIASNPDCDIRLPNLKPWRERFLYRYGLQNADLIVAQTLHQQKMLQEGFKLSAKVIPMPCAGLANNSERSSAEIDPPHVLWVGRFSEEKRLEWLLDAAEALPQYVFDVAGAPNTANSEYAKNLQDRGKTIPNVILHGRVSDQVFLSTLYRQARLLCCTSVFEGFPNTFLEAWSIGLPIVSTFDPDSLIVRKGLGKTASTVREVCQGITALIQNQEFWVGASSAARVYFNTHHTLEAVMPNFTQLLQQVYLS